MKKVRIFLGIMGLVVAGLCSCSSDEPTPVEPVEPDTPTQPQPETPDTPETPDQPTHPQKDWQGETPHGFLVDATMIKLPIGENGFLICNGKEEIVIDHSLKPDDDDPISYSPRKANSDATWYNGSNIWFDGVLADPFENTDLYIQTCLRFGFRPNSQFSGFEDLLKLPVPRADYYFSAESITSIDVITENYFDKDHPAGSSMKQPNNMFYETGMAVHIMPGAPYFKMWAQGKDLQSGIQGRGVTLPLGNVYDESWTSYPAESISLNITGFPEKAGEYPMTMIMTMNGGKKTLEIKFVIKYVDK